MNVKFKKLKAFYNKSLKDKSISNYKDNKFKVPQPSGVHKTKSRWKTIK